MSVAALSLSFFRRELRNRFAGSFSGGLWALVQPLIQLAVYAFFFVYVMRINVAGVNPLAFLATALWPWTAFSEGILRSTTAIQDNAALIGKVALPREVLVLASVASSFAVHLAGLIAILVALAIFGKGVDLAGLPLAIVLFVPLFATTLGFALIFAAVQVFVRDLAQALGQLLQLLMFTAPVFYDRTLIPGPFAGWLDANPYTFYAEAFRVVLLHHGSVGTAQIGIALATSALLLAGGHWLFRRLDPHFEDFL